MLPIWWFWKWWKSKSSGLNLPDQMARYQLKIAYDGTNFSGYQRQGEKRTVQGEIEKALFRLNWTGQTIFAAGRTDTGVHASGQVISFDFEWTHGCEALQKALNALLPDDIAVHAVKVAADEFHPRYNATSRCYHYRIYCQPERNPLINRFSWQVWPPVKCFNYARCSTGFAWNT